MDSVEEMTDTSKSYVLTGTGTIWVHRLSTVTKTVMVTDEIVGTEDNPYLTGQRFSSSGDDYSSDASGYVISPKINIMQYAGKRIELHLDGLMYFSEGTTTWVQNRFYDTDGNVVVSRSYSCAFDNANNAFCAVTSDAILTINSDTSSTITMDIPLIYGSSSIEIGYLRFSAQGAESDSNVYITYEEEQTITDEQWVDTGVSYTGSGVDEETLNTIAELNNEGSDPTTVTLLPSPVLDFYNADTYSDDDYTVSHLERITYPCRADIPVPFVVKWNYNEDAMRTTVAVDTKNIGTLNAYTMKMYDATGLNKYPLYNLIPNTRYYYKVTHVLSDGSIVEAKSGNFVTSSETLRLIYIDGTQNVRDLGGWTGLDGATVKYGNIFRGASLSDSSFPELIVTGKGRRALGELDVQAELNLGASDVETSIASNCSYTKIGYNNYASAITNETYRGYFKTALEWIVDCLTNSKPVYMHCQGGCDRTGTLSFQLLGLLGVSESDLAKEYELSSFSSIGFGRLRTTTLEANTYDYVGMVEAIKAYDGDTITDKFYNFAIACGVSADTITSFRSLMLA